MVNRSGFGSSSNIAIIIEGTGERTAESYNGTSSSAAVLHVDYIIGGGSSNQSPNVAVTSPSNGTAYDNLATINLQANASDSDGSVDEVRFYVDGALVGTDASAPYSVNWAIPAWGDYDITAVAEDNDGAMTTSSVISISAIEPDPGGGTPITISVRVNSGNDDAEEATSGTMYLTSSDLELVYDSYQSAGNQKVGMRFRNIGIPQGATITDAYIQFTVDETKNDNGTKYIHGEDVNDAATFSSSSNNISNRPLTSASVSWNPASWNSVGAAGADQRTPDLSSIVQEIVNRSGWSSGNDMVMIVSGSGRRVAESYNGSSSKAPLLVVEYVAPSVPNSAITVQSIDFKVYPNPVDEQLNVVFGEDLDGVLQLVDMQGRVVKEEWIQNRLSLFLNVSDLPAGNYLLTVNAEAVQQTRRVIVR